MIKLEPRVGTDVKKNICAMYDSMFNGKTPEGESLIMNVNGIMIIMFSESGGIRNER